MPVRGASAPCVFWAFTYCSHMCDAEKRDFGTRLVAKDEETVRVELRLGSSWPTNVELTAWALEGKEPMAIERRTFSIDFEKEEAPRIVGNEPLHPGCLAQRGLGLPRQSGTPVVVETKLYQSLMAQ